jgi:MFS family permease
MNASSSPDGRRSVWREPGLGRLVVSIAISQIGSGITGVGLPILLLQRYGLGVGFGLTLGVRVIPNILLGTVVAETVKRWDPRAVAIVTSLCSAAVATAIPFTTALWQIQVLAFLIGLTSMFAAPARLALRSRVVPPGRELESNGLIVTAQRVAGLLGPVLAGPILAFSHVSVLFFVEAITAVLAATLLVGAFPPARAVPDDADAPTAAPQPKTPLSILRRLVVDNPRQLVTLIRRDRMVMGLTYTAFTYVFAVGLNSVFIPAFASVRFPSVHGMLGYLVAAMGLGGAAGGLLAGRLRKANPGWLYILGNVLEAVCWLTLILVHQPVLAIAVLVTGGVMESVATAAYMAEVQARMGERELSHYYSMLLPSNDVFFLAGATVAGVLVAPGRIDVSIAVIAGMMAVPIIVLARTFFTPRPSATPISSAIPEPEIPVELVAGEIAG